MSITTSPKKVSIHAPMKSAAATKMQGMSSPLRVSIHAPTKGAAYHFYPTDLAKKIRRLSRTCQKKQIQRRTARLVGNKSKLLKNLQTLGTSTACRISPSVFKRHHPTITAGCFTTNAACLQCIFQDYPDNV